MNKQSVNNYRHQLVLAGLWKTDDHTDPSTDEKAADRLKEHCEVRFGVKLKIQQSKVASSAIEGSIAEDKPEANPATELEPFIIQAGRSKWKFYIAGKPIEIAVGETKCIAVCEGALELRRQSLEPGTEL